MVDPRHPLAAHRTARRVLIACEGRATEPGYFQAIRRHLHLPERVVSILPNAGSSPKTLVQRLIKAREANIEEGEFNAGAGDTAWVVCDGDEHRLADPKAWKEALALASAHDIRLAVSNPSFELWYLLHFQDQFAPLDARQALERLKRHLPRYNKNATLFPEPLLPLLPAAIDRAKRLEARAEGAFANPSSAVYLLVEHLFSLGR